MNDLHALGAAEAARQIRAGTLSPVDLLDACLARIEVASDRLPLSVQLVGRVWGEAGLLAAAAWCEQVVGFKEAPGA
jgi:Asp-tRNA(Asn)/Glu-tRNA(Gln) amidotransferase A subunit family amidase